MSINRYAYLMYYQIKQKITKRVKMSFSTHTKILLISITFIPMFSSANALSTLPIKERVAYFTQAQHAGITGVAIKTKPVLARPAKEGEIITTIIKGEGIETVSEPARKGDWVVQNICPETGNEEILVRKEKFSQRYNKESNGSHDVKTLSHYQYQQFIPKGIEMNYFIVPDTTPTFAMKAPWGELQRFQPGDAVVQSTMDDQDIYRIQKTAFECTYTIIQSAKSIQ